MAESSPVPPRPAAAVVLLRDGAEGIEVFMVRRHIQSDFSPDVFVFPGGSVTETDRDAELLPGLTRSVGEGPTTLGSGFRVAALRECFEEAGVLLATRDGAPLAIEGDAVDRYAAYRTALQKGTLTLENIARSDGLQLATDALVHWAHWITPESMPKRFDTHFFLADMPTSQQAAADRLETTEDVWIRPEDALRQFEDGSFPLVFATVHQLRALTGMRNAEAAKARFAGMVPRTIMPRTATREGAEVILLPDEE